MEITRDLLDDIYDEIEKHNSELGETAVPYATDIIKYICSDSGTTDVLVKESLQILVDVHKIFPIEIVASDEAHGIDKVVGFVVADKSVVHDLLVHHQDQLVIAYQKQFGENLGIFKIIKEIFPKMGTLNNTEIGKIANKAIMLNEYSRLLEKDFQEYTDKWQNEKLSELLKTIGIENKKKKETSESEADTPGKDSATDTLRAVDSHAYKDYKDKKNSYPLKRILNIYGLDFFLKVNFRKCEFEFLKKVVDDNQISSRADLLKMKDMVHKVKINMYKDIKLHAYENAIYDLERSISHALYFTVNRPPKK